MVYRGGVEAGGGWVRRAGAWRLCAAQEQRVPCRACCRRRCACSASRHPASRPSLAERKVGGGGGAAQAHLRGHWAEWAAQGRCKEHQGRPRAWFGRAREGWAVLGWASRRRRSPGLAPPRHHQGAPHQGAVVRARRLLLAGVQAQVHVLGAGHADARLPAACGRWWGAGAGEWGGVVRRRTGPGASRSAENRLRGSTRVWAAGSGPPLTLSSAPALQSHQGPARAPVG